MPRLPLARIILVVALGLLAACASCYSAPVADIDAMPRFIDSGRTHRVNGGETLYVVAWMYDLDVNALARANNLREPYNISPGQILSVDLRGTPGATAANPAPVGNATVTPAAVATGIRRAPLESAPLTRQTLPSTPLPDSAAPATTPPPVTRTEPTLAPRRETPAATNTPPPAVATAPAPSVTAPTPTPTPPPAAVADANTASSAPLSPANEAIAWAWPTRGNIIGRYSDSDPDNKGIKFGGNEGDTVMAAADGEVVYTGNGLLRYGELVILKHNDHFLSAYAHNRSIAVKEGERVTRGQKIAELGSTGIDRDMLHFEIRLDGKPVDPMTYLPAR